LVEPRTGAGTGLDSLKNQYEAKPIKKTRKIVLNRQKLFSPLNRHCFYKTVLFLFSFLFHLSSSQNTNKKGEIWNHTIFVGLRQREKKQRKLETHQKAK